MSIYTDMFLTHIDADGNSSYPVLIEKARYRGRAANYPEFINLPADYTFNMVYNYVNLDHIKRAMLAVDAWILNDAPAVRMLMQVHEDALWMLENMGVRVEDERPYRIDRSGGEVLWVQGKSEAALRVWREAAEVDGDNPVLIETLERLDVTL